MYGKWLDYSKIYLIITVIVKTTSSSFKLLLSGSLKPIQVLKLLLLILKLRAASANPTPLRSLAELDRCHRMSTDIQIMSILCCGIAYKKTQELSTKTYSPNM